MPIETWWQEGVKDSFYDLCRAMGVEADLDTKFTINAILRYFSEFYPCYDAKLQFDAALYTIAKRTIASITGRNSDEDEKIVAAIYARLHYKVAPIFEKFVFPASLDKKTKRPNMDDIDLAVMKQELETVMIQYQTLDQDTSLDDKDKAVATEAYEAVCKAIIAEAELILKESTSYLSMTADPIETSLLQAESDTGNRTFEAEMVNLFTAISKEPATLARDKPATVKISEELNRYLRQQLRGALVAKIGAEAESLLMIFDEIYAVYSGDKQDVKDLKEFLVEAKHSDSYVEYVGKLNIVFTVMNQPGVLDAMTVEDRSRLEKQKQRILRLILKYKDLPVSAKEPEIVDKNAYSLIVAVLDNHVDPLLFQALLQYLQPNASVKMELERLAAGTSRPAEQKLEETSDRTEYPAELKEMQNLPKLMIVAMYFVMSKQDVAPDEKEFQAFIDRLKSEVLETKDLDLRREELVKITNVLFKHLMSNGEKAKDTPKKMLFTPEEGGINRAMQTIAQRKAALEEAVGKSKAERTLKQQAALRKEQAIAQSVTTDRSKDSGGNKV